MTTTITENEIKLIYIEIMLIAVIGVFLFFYIGNPIQSTTMDTTIANAQDKTVSSSDASWITGLASPTLGLPVGATEIIVVSSIFLIPLTIMNTFIALRFIKDIATGWI